MFVSKEKFEQLKTKYDKLSFEHDKLKDKLSNLAEEYEVKKAHAYKTMELELKEQHMKKVENIRKEYDKKLEKEMTENFEKLKKSLTKLHEEGNANTKYVEKVSLKMMDAFKRPNLNVLENKE